MTADLPARLQTIRAELEAVTDHEAMPFRRVKSSDGSGTGVVDNHGSVIAYGCCIAVADLIASAPDTVARLLAAVEGVVAIADKHEVEAKRLQAKAGDFIWGEVRSRYLDRASIEQEHADTIRRALTDALGEK